VTKPAPTEDQGEERLEVGPRDRAAAGLPAVIASLRHTHDQMGLRRGVRTLLRLNQHAGFDCPGCAWPEPHKTSRFEFCENGAKAVAWEATVRQVGPAFFAEHPVFELAERSEYWLGQQGRITEPVYRPAGSDHYEPISWDDAFGLIAGELLAMASPDRAVFYTSGRTSNEAAFVYQLFVRALGTNNLPDCSNMCHESSGEGLGATIGVGKGTVTLDDIEKADLILVVGQNPGTNHPRMLTALEIAKRSGTKIVAINPLPEAGLIRFRNPQTPRGLSGVGTPLADLYLQVKTGADMALFQLLNRRLVEDGAIDEDFITHHCAGFEELAAHLRALDPDELLAGCGLDASEVEQLVEMAKASERTIVCWAMGLTQHKASVATIQEIVNFLLLRGSIGKPGAGACPVRGHSNVQGDRTMGIWERPTTEFLDRLQAEFGFDPPRDHGFDTVRAIRAMRDGEVDVFFSMGGNFVAAAPDTDATAAALSRCRLTVQVSTKLNRSHVLGGQASMILPCLGRTEHDFSGGHQQFISVEDSMGMVHASSGGNPPTSPHLRSEVAVVCGLAKATLGDRHGIDWDGMARDYDRIRDHVSHVVPGFEAFNAKVRQDAGFELPNAARDSRSFATASGRAEMTLNRFEPIVVPPGRLLLQTVRSHDQYNTTIYGLDDRYRGIHQGRRVVFVGAGDLARLGLADGATVDIVSEWRDGSERRAPAFRVVEYDIAAGCCAAYFPEANVLVPLDSTADRSGTPTSKSVVVRLEPTP
jgi:molybdopterin-dependent oxidoreductase alpha subunit